METYSNTEEGLMKTAAIGFGSIVVDKWSIPLVQVPTCITEFVSFSGNVIDGARFNNVPFIIYDTENPAIDLTDTVFRNCVFFRCLFDGHILSDYKVTFDNCQFIDCIFDRPYMVQVNFNNCNLAGSKIKMVADGVFTINRGSFKFSNLRNFNYAYSLSTAIVATEVNFFRADLRKSLKQDSCIFETCNLMNADLSSNNLSGCQFISSTNLTNATLDFDLATFKANCEYDETLVWTDGLLINAVR